MFYPSRYEIREMWKKRAKKRYNHRKGFQRKMVEYKRVTHDNVYIEFQRIIENHVENDGSISVQRYSTDQTMLCRNTPVTPALSIEERNTSTSSLASLNSPSS